MKRLVEVELSQQEIWAAMRRQVQRNRKKYRRKEKHKGREED